MADCIFCKIARYEIPADIVCETDELLGFRDVSPRAPVHVLIIPKDHIAGISSATDDHAELLGQLLRAAAQVARNEKIAQSGFRVVINDGLDGGQTVDHLHVHLLGGRKLTWPPG